MKRDKKIIIGNKIYNFNFVVNEIYDDLRKNPESSNNDIIEMISILINVSKATVYNAVRYNENFEENVRYRRHFIPETIKINVVKDFEIIYGTNSAKECVGAFCKKTAMKFKISEQSVRNIIKSHDLYNIYVRNYSMYKVFVR